MISHSEGRQGQAIWRVAALGVRRLLRFYFGLFFHLYGEASNELSRYALTMEIGIVTGSGSH